MKLLRDQILPIGVLGAVLVLMAVGFWPLLGNHLPGAIVAPEEDLSYAPFVPIFSLWVLWCQRAQWREALAGAPSWIGLLACLPALLVGVLGVRGEQLRFELLSAVSLLVTVPWALFGARAARLALFPAGYLLFMMPMTSFLAPFTVHLRLLVSAVSCALLSGCGVEVVRTGNIIVAHAGADASGFAVDVADPCSGLRSVVALAALAAAYGYFTHRSNLKRVLLFASSLPIAVLGNILRIFSICAVASAGQRELALGFYHDFSGFIVFGGAIVLLLAVDRLVAMLPEGAVAASEAQCAERPRCALRCTAVNAFAVLAIVGGTMLWQRLTPPPRVCEAPPVALPTLAGYRQSPIEPSGAETNLLLNAGAKIGKMAYMRYGETNIVTFVVSSARKSSLHRPELCLPSQGVAMLARGEIEAGGARWRTIAISAGGPTAQATFAYTFFNQDGYRTCSHVARVWRDVLDRSFGNRIDRWCMVTVQSSITDPARFRDFLDRLKEVSP